MASGLQSSALGPLGEPRELATGLGWGRPSDTLVPSSGQVSALRRLAKPMSDRVAGRTSQKPPMLDSGAEVSASTTSSEPESGARSVSSIVRQWNRKINNFLGDPSPSANGARPPRSGQGLCGRVARRPGAPVSGFRLVAGAGGFLLCVWLEANLQREARAVLVRAGMGGGGAG